MNAPTVVGGFVLSLITMVIALAILARHQNRPASVARAAWFIAGVLLLGAAVFGFLVFLALG